MANKDRKYYPDLYVEKVTDIELEYLEKNNIKGLIIDLDNTLLDFSNNVLEGIEKWHETITKNGIKTIIVSNTIIRKRVVKMAEILNSEYVYFAIKPFKIGFRFAKRKLNLKNEEIAVIGDQIFTDVLGAKRMKMKAILVKPMIRKRDYFITKIKRPMEEKVLKNYLNTLKNKENKLKEEIKEISNNKEEK